MEECHFQVGGKDTASEKSSEKEGAKQRSVTHQKLPAGTEDWKEEADSPFRRRLGDGTEHANI